MPRSVVEDRRWLNLAAWIGFFPWFFDASGRHLGISPYLIILGAGLPFLLSALLLMDARISRAPLAVWIEALRDWAPVPRRLLAGMALLWLVMLWGHLALRWLEYFESAVVALTHLTREIVWGPVLLEPHPVLGRPVGVLMLAAVAAFVALRVRQVSVRALGWQVVLWLAVVGVSLYVILGPGVGLWLARRSVTDPMAVRPLIEEGLLLALLGVLGLGSSMRTKERVQGWRLAIPAMVTAMSGVFFGTVVMSAGLAAGAPVGDIARSMEILFGAWGVVLLGVMAMVIGVYFFAAVFGDHALQLGRVLLGGRIDGRVRSLVLLLMLGALAYVPLSGPSSFLAYGFGPIAGLFVVFARAGSVDAEPLKGFQQWALVIIFGALVLAMSAFTWWGQGRAWDIALMPISFASLRLAGLAVIEVKRGPAIQGARRENAPAPLPAEPTELEFSYRDED